MASLSQQALNSASSSLRGSVSIKAWHGGSMAMA
jgi:hypothetical protein